MSRGLRFAPRLLLGAALAAATAACTPDAFPAPGTSPGVGLDVSNHAPQRGFRMEHGSVDCGGIYNTADRDLRDGAAILATSGRAAPYLRDAEEGFNRFLSACVSPGSAAHAARVAVVWLAFFQADYGKVVALTYAAKSASMRDLRNVLLACPGERAALRELGAAQASALARLTAEASAHFRFAGDSTACGPLRDYVAAETSTEI